MTATTAHADAESIALRKSWNLGFAWGHTYAGMLGTASESFALQRIAVQRPHAVRARTLDEALAHSEPQDPARRVFSSAVLLAWGESGCERDDAELCSNCWLVVLTDIEESFECASGDHGTTCSEACRDEACRQPRCGAEL